MATPLRILFAGRQTPENKQLFQALDEEGRDISLRCVSHCTEALESLADMCPQAFFLNWDDMDERSKKSLKEASSAHPEIPFIAVISESGNRAASEAIGSGACGFIGPKTLDQAHEILRKYLEATKSSQRLALEDDSPHISEKYFKQLVDISQEGIAFVKADGRIQYCNPAFGKIIDLDHTYITGTNIQNLVREEYRETVRSLLEPGSSGSSRKTELQLRSPLQRDTWCMMTVLPVHNENKEFDGLLVQLSDITDRKVLEARQKEQHDRLMFHLNSTPLGFVEWDDQCTITQWSKRMERFLGWEASEVVGKHPWDWNFIHETDAQAFRNSFKELTSGWTSSQAISLGVYDRGGAVHRVDFYSSVHRNDVSGKSFILTQILDVTDQLQAQKALRESEERFDLAVRGAGLGVWDWWLNEDRIVYNRRAARLMGLPSNISECTVQEWTANMHLQDQSQAGNIIMKHLKGDSTHFENEYRVRDQGGGVRWVLDRARVVDRDASGKAIRVSGTQMDITERKRVEIELKTAKDASDQANRAKSTFLAHMSHDIRTPLNSILGFADIMSHENLSPDNQEVVELIKKSGHRLLHTLNSVLDLAQLEGNQMRMKIMRIDVGDLAADIVQLLENSARGKGLNLSLEVLEDGPVYAAADEVALHRVISNLVNNAITYTSSGGITLSVFQQNGSSIIKVTDTGIGIEAKRIPGLFDSMRSIEEPLQMKRSDGTGLGLTICKGLLQLMHGEIAVSSEVGKGSVFTVQLRNNIDQGQNDTTDIRSPNIPVSKMEEEMSEVPFTESVSNLKSILVVDDDEITRKMYQRFLEGDYEVSIVPGFDEALAAARNSRFDVMFLDINLGEERTGKDLLVMLRDIPGYETTPVVACTAFALPGDKENLLNSGFKMYLSKPFSYKRLKDAVEELLATED